MGENKIKKNGGGEGAKVAIRIVGGLLERFEVVINLDGKGKGDAGAREEKKRQDGKGKGDAGAGEGKKRQEKEPPITTAVLKVHLPCQECIEDFYKILVKFKGCRVINMDEKGLTTVRGSMNNLKDLVAKLKKHLKKVEIVALKKESGEKKEKAKGNGKGKGKVKA